jgi:hypothetical protein
MSLLVNTMAARFQIKNPALGKFFRALEWKRLVDSLAIWNILQQFGTFYGHLVIQWQFGIFPPVLVYCHKKNLATAVNTPYLVTRLMTTFLSQMALSVQTELTAEMRKTLLLWLLAINGQFGFCFETWCLTVRCGETLFSFVLIVDYSNQGQMLLF